MVGKLVRDKIPEIIRNSGKVPFIHIADNEEYWKKLKEKLKEEVNEFLEESTAEELADILEVIYAICDFLRIDKSYIEEIRRRKRKERGGFTKRIILDNVK